MKRFDPISAVLGVIFVLAGLYFADGSRRPSFSDLGLVVPLLPRWGAPVERLRGPSEPSPAR